MLYEETLSSVNNLQSAAKKNYMKGYIIMDIDKLREASFRNTTNPAVFLDEKWLPIHEYVPNIMPWYWISNTGKIFSIQINALMKYDYVGKGYLKVTLQSTSGPVDMLVHRLVMLCFHPISNPDSFTVNHKDGDHENNYDSNLEWATYVDQMVHASETGLLNTEYYSESEVRAICKELEQNSNQDEVIYKLYGNIKLRNYPYYVKIKHLVNRIQRKISWQNISCEYNILTKENINPNQVLSDSQVEAICQVLEKYGKDIPTRKVYQLIGIDIGNPGEKNYIRYMSTMVNIRNRKCFDYITSKYNF